MDYSKYYPQEFKDIDSQEEKIELDQFEGKEKVFAEERLLQAEEKEKEKYRVKMDRFYTPTYRQEIARQIGESIKDNPLRACFVPKNIMHGYIHTPKNLCLKLSIFIYLVSHCGAYPEVRFSLKRFAVEWMHKSGNGSMVQLNEYVLEIFQELWDIGYIKFVPDVLSGSKFDYIVTLHQNRITKACGNENSRFAIFYEDELERILETRYPYRVLGVYAFLKFKIYYRRREVDDRLNTYPEVYASTYKYIKKTLHMSDYIFNNIIDELSDLNLVKFIPPIRIAYVDKEGNICHRTIKAIFCLYDRRRDGVVLDSGENYYLRELKAGIVKYHYQSAFNRYCQRTKTTLEELVAQDSNGRILRHVDVGVLTHMEEEPEELEIKD